uniref:Mitochondrial carrier protein CGI-69 n=1 Tax=Glossina morsitans morsitans TaxID=37546 RepID=A0A1B0FAG2_GLOMM
MNDPAFKIGPLYQMASAFTGAVVTAVIITPMDVIKTRMQMQHRKCYIYCNGLMDHFYVVQKSKTPKIEESTMSVNLKGITETFLTIRKAEGVKGFWSGLGPTLLLALPTTIVYFLTYEELKKELLKLTHHINDRYMIDASFFVPLASSMPARFLAATASTPFEMVRIKMQSEQMSYRQLGETLKEIIDTRGIAGLWHGLPPLIMRDVPFSAIYWTTYETIKSQFPEYRSKFLFSFISGGISGMLAATLTTPFDVVTTHVQLEIGEKVVQKEKTIESLSIARRLNELYRNRGMKGIFSGLSIRLYKVVPACAIMISVFECGNRYFYNYDRRKN